MNKRDFLVSCQEYAETKNGKCLSTEYKNTHLKLMWQCEFGHIWEAIPSNVKRGKWCPVCAKNKKCNLQDCIDFAKIKDGYCLSTEYVNASSNLIWQCKFGHTWGANFNNIKSKGSWCPKCSSNIGENICRVFFEKVFNQPFSKTKPKWMKLNTYSHLELDGFNDSLNIAFEYQGAQHYQLDGFFNRTQEQLDKRIKDDLLKKQLCEDNGVKLIIIPYFKKITNINDVIIELRNIFFQNGFGIIDNISIDLNELSSDKIQKYKKIAKLRGGECLSNSYISYYTKLTWQCSNGHIWDALGFSIEKGHWCPDCAGNRKKIK